jgi:hypothetical protein
MWVGYEDISYRSGCGGPNAPRTSRRWNGVSHAPVDPYFCVVQRGAVDESLPYVETIDLERSSQGGAVADVGLVRLDVQEIVVNR